MLSKHATSKRARKDFFAELMELNTSTTIAADNQSINNEGEFLTDSLIR